MTFRGDPVDVVETHVSTLFFLGERVYKLRKPVRYGFLDFSSREAREADCHRELALNRRYAPDVYLGVYDITEAGRLIDHLVVMRRLPHDRRLSTLVRDKKVTRGDLEAVVRTLLDGEAAAARSADIDTEARRDALQAQWRANSNELAPFVGSIIDPACDARLLELADDYLVGRELLLEARIRGGRVRDGHGDLRAEDIFMMDDGPRILDCIEFDDRLRYGDVLADIGFLAMDLERLGAPELRRALFDCYADTSGDRFPQSLPDYYCGARAYVRAKVSCLAAAEGMPGADEDARAHHELARSFLERARVQLVLVGGLPGTGKSTLAAAVGDAIGATVLRSDVVRHELASAAPSRPDLYSEPMTEATYARLLDVARVALELGDSVILDASWSDERRRAGARALAAATRSALVELRCEAPMELTERRIEERRRRGLDESDATVAVAHAMSAVADPWSGATAIDTSVAVGDSVAAVLSMLGGEQRTFASTARGDEIPV
ncbi:MAG: AAA family ATPase [Acidimicrobiales bacterium]